MLGISRISRRFGPRVEGSNLSPRPKFPRIGQFSLAFSFVRFRRVVCRGALWGLLEHGGMPPSLVRDNDDMENLLWLDWHSGCKPSHRRASRIAGILMTSNATRRVQQIAAEIMASGAGLEERAGSESVQGSNRVRDAEGGRAAAVFDADRCCSCGNARMDAGLFPAAGPTSDAPRARMRFVKSGRIWLRIRGCQAGLRLRPNRQGHPPMPFHAYKLFFICRLTGGARRPATRRMPWTSSTSGASATLARARAPAQITHMFDHHRHPEWPTSFD